MVGYLLPRSYDPQQLTATGERPGVSPLQTPVDFSSPTTHSSCRGDQRPTEGLEGLDQDDYIEALATLGLGAEVDV